MITFPHEFTATKYPGYFWNVEKKELYSIKVTGELRKLKRVKSSHFNRYFDGYVVSHRGCRRHLTMEYLQSLKTIDTVIPVAGQTFTEDYLTFGDCWVYCNQHLRPHKTGWCTVSVKDKIVLSAKTEQDAYSECVKKGLKIYGHD